MKISLFAACAALLFSACLNTGKTPPSSATPPPEAAPGVEKPASEQQGRSFTISTTAYYQGGLSSPSAPGRVVSLTLAPNGYAKMVMDYQESNQVTSDTGAWKTQANGNVLLHLRRIGGRDTTSLEFRPDGERLVYTGSLYGPEGLVLETAAHPAYGGAVGFFIKK